MGDGIGLAEALLGLDGFRVLEVHETAAEVVVRIETTATVVGCDGCGVRARAQDRVERAVRDLPCFGRPARLVWVKRRWRCREPLCARKTWTETSPQLDAPQVLTDRAGAEACRQVGELARPVSKVAEELGVCWWTVMNATIEHGTRLIGLSALVWGVEVGVGVHHVGQGPRHRHSCRRQQRWETPAMGDGIGEPRRPDRGRDRPPPRRGCQMVCVRAPHEMR